MLPRRGCWYDFFMKTHIIKLLFLFVMIFCIKVHDICDFFIIFADVF